MFYKVTYIVLLCIFLPIAGYSQQLIFNNIGIKQGVSQSAVITLLQDSDDLMWIGTWDGLNKYDGYSFTKYFKTPNDTNSLYDNSIVTLCEDSYKNIWIGTSMGSPVVLEKWTGKMRRITERWKDAPIHKQSGVISLLRRGEYIYSFTHYFIMRIHEKTLQKKFFFYDNLKRGGPAICDAQGRIWSFGADVVRQIDPETCRILRSIPIPEIKPRKDYEWVFGSMEQISENELLIASKFDGIFVLNIHAGRARLLVKPSQYENQNVNTVHIDKSGTLWIGTEYGLFYKFSNEQFDVKFHVSRKIQGNENSLCSNIIYSVFEDKAGILWFCTDLGISRYIPKRSYFTVVPTTRAANFPLPDALMFAVLEDNTGNVWVATNQGLIRYVSNEQTAHEVYTARNSTLINTPISNLFLDSQKQLWVGSKGALYKYIHKKNTFERIKLPENPVFPSDNILIYSIAEDSRGVIWIGTNGGLYEYQKASQTLVAHLTELTRESGGIGRQLCIVPRDGFIWCGTDGAGLIRYNPNERSYIKFMSGQPAGKSVAMDKIFHILPISDTLFVLSTGGGGAQLLQNPNGKAVFIDINTSNGLLNNFIYGSFKDNQNKIWLSSNAGFSRLDPKTKEIKNFTTQDGLPSNECMQNGFYFSKDGNAYITMVGGLVKFRPEQVGINPFRPKPVITDFKVYNESQAYKLQDSIIYIDYNQNMFSFSFASMSFEQPERNIFAYKLVGFRDEWIYTGTRNEAYFTNIDPGTYYFKVKSTNNEGMWGDKVAQVKLIIVPPFWKTLWFKIIIILIFLLFTTGLIVYVIRRRYVEQLNTLRRQNEIQEERQKVRDRIARDLHDDLASTVSSVGLFLESAKNKVSGVNSEADNYLNKSAELLNEAEDAISDIVWYVTPKNDTMQSLIARVRLLNNEICSANRMIGVTEIDGTTDFERVLLTEEIRRNIFMIFKEALKNCIKYAHAKKFTVQFSGFNGEISIILSDDGVGNHYDDTQTLHGGNGLKNMRKRATEIGAKIEMGNLQNGGFYINIKFPLQQLI